MIISSATNPTSHIDQYAFKLAKKKFKIFQFIDNWYDIENRLNKTNGFNQYPDHLLLPDEYLKKITNKFYDNHGIEVVGHQLSKM